MKTHSPNWPGWRAAGFTIVELMAVLGIAAILMTVAVPSFHNTLQKQRMGTAVSDFFAAINLTRSEAIQRGARVDLVPLNGADWAKGWVVFVDQNHNQKPDAQESIIFSHGPVPDGITIKSTLTDSKVQYLAYNGTGRSRTNANSQTPQAGNFSFSQEKQIRRIKINFLGRPRMCDPEIDGTSC